MTQSDEPSGQAIADALPTGPGAAAILAAGVGALALGVLALAADAVPALRQALNIWRPTGPLSGVSTAAVAIWLGAWMLLSWRWSGRNVRLGPVNLVAFVMLAIGVLLTFPPFMDWLQRK